MILIMAHNYVRNSLDERTSILMLVEDILMSRQTQRGADIRVMLLSILIWILLRRDPQINMWIP